MINDMKSPEEFAKGYFSMMEPKKGQRANLELGRMIADRAANVLDQGQYNAFIKTLNRLKGGR